MNSFTKNNPLTHTLGYPTILKTHKEKFEPRTNPHIFIGYPFGTKVYKVLDLATKRIHVSRDVQFYENVFPFAYSPDHSSFPSVLKNMNSRSTFMFHVDNTLDEYQWRTENTPPSVTALLVSIEQIDTSPCTSHTASPTNDAPLLADQSLSSHQPHQSSFPDQTLPPSTSSSH